MLKETGWNELFSIWHIILPDFHQCKHDADVWSIYNIHINIIKKTNTELEYVPTHEYNIIIWCCIGENNLRLSSYRLTFQVHR